RTAALRADGRRRGQPTADARAEQARRTAASHPKGDLCFLDATIYPQSMTWMIVGDLDEIEQPIRDMDLGEVKIITAH
ncbi:MAG: hypothetical protein P8008_01010, partial [Gammaproteobacteria bacterium]